MKKSLYIYAFLFIGPALFASCGNNSEDPADSPLVINIPEDDDECCSYDDELAMRRLFADYQEVDDLSGIIFDKYTIRVYARYATLRVGYTELLFAVEKTATNQHVKDIQISDFVPVMTMGAMGMKHSAPTANSFSKIDGLPVYKIWFAPLMASDENSFWELSLNYSVKGSVGKTENLRFNVVAQPSGNTWIKSFKLIDRTYYLTLVNAENFQTGINTIQAYIHVHPDVIPDSVPGSSFALSCPRRRASSSSVLTLIIIIIKLVQKGLVVSKVVSAMDMRQNFGTLLNQVAIKDEEIVIERAGKPLARLVSMNSATSGKLDFRDIGKLPNDIWNE